MRVKPKSHMSTGGADLASCPAQSQVLWAQEMPERLEPISWPTSTWKVFSVHHYRTLGCVGKPVDNSTPERVTICPTRVPQFSLVEALFLLDLITIHSGACERRGDVWGGFVYLHEQPRWYQEPWGDSPLAHFGITRLCDETFDMVMSTPAIATSPYSLLG